MNMKSKLIPTSVALWVTLGILPLAAQAQVQDTPPAPAPSALPADTPEIDQTSYVLAPSDSIDIDLQGNTDMHRTVSILNDGTISYPVVGTFKAAGMTPLELKTYLQGKLSLRYNQPSVTVAVLQAHARRIDVEGPVRSPGLYDYRPGQHLLDLITSAGGLVASPETTQALLITNKGTKSIPVDLVALVNDGDQTQNLPVSPGDQFLLSPKDPAKAAIHVVGQVVKPGDFSVVNNGATVLAMLTEAGGATPGAALTHAQILRHDSDKVETVNLHPLKFNLDDPAGKIRLYAGDTLLLPENNNKIYVLGEVRSNSAMYIPDGETLTVAQALANAGGSDDDGDKKNVGVIHHTVLKNGAVKSTLVVVNVQDLMKNQNNVTDVALQPGDYLIVPTRKKGHSIGEYLSGVSQAAYGVLGIRAL
jgi:polysaccharide export outer membrane protein